MTAVGTRRIESILLANGARIDGFCDPAFEAVADVFAGNFLHQNELGASVCVVVDGRPVVDLWGGVRCRRTGEPWRSDTLAVVFSCTKAASALCAHILIHRGLLDLHAPITRYWPEFAKGGKEQASVLMALNHSLGLPALRDPVKRGGFYNYGYMVSRLQDEAVFWEPGTRHGYHALTYGWIVAEIIRRVSGKPLGHFFRDEIAAPLGLDFWLGLPEEHEARVAPIESVVPGPDWTLTDFALAVVDNPDSIQSLATLNRGGYNANTREAHVAGLGAAGGITNARSLAGLFAPLAAPRPSAGVSALHRLSAARIDEMRRDSVPPGPDATLLIPTRFGQGFMLSMDNRPMPEGHSMVIGDTAFGHVGQGGSIGFADPQAGLAFGYVMNRQGSGILLNRRGQSLIDMVYEILR